MKFMLTLVTLTGLVNIGLSKNHCKVVLNIPGVGKVKGRNYTTTNGGHYISYKNIPYGQIKEKGWFQPAEPIPESDEVVNDSRFITCPVEWYFRPHIEEAYRKCLLLKVISKDTTELKPVIVYISPVRSYKSHIDRIHGKYIMTKDVVVVAVQYRIGAFGFLSTSTNDIPGNIGVLDVIDALKWIQKYIAYFGGDSNRVTVEGEYLAAGLIGVLTASPLAEGLFQQVIYHSGSINITNLATDNPLQISGGIAAELGCLNITDADQVTKFLLQANYTKLLTAYNSRWEKFPLITVGGPSGVYEWNNRPRKYPILGGFVEHPAVDILEGSRQTLEPCRFSHSYYAKKYKKILAEFEYEREYIPIMLVELYYEYVPEINLSIKNVLLDGLMKAYVPFDIDVVGLEIKLNVIKSLLNNIKLGGQSYLYLYKYKTYKYYCGKNVVLNNIATIGDDLKYIYPNYKLNKEEKNISNLMVDLWTSFAATGVPSSPEVVYWPEMVSASGPYLSIDNATYVGWNITKEFTPTIDCRKTKGCKWTNF